MAPTKKTNQMKLVKEHPDRFIVRIGAREFPIAKANLHPATVAKMQQRFYAGGEVQPQRMASGGIAGMDMLDSMLPTVNDVPRPDPAAAAAERAILMDPNLSQGMDTPQPGMDVSRVDPGLQSFFGGPDPYAGAQRMAQGQPMAAPQPEAPAAGGGDYSTPPGGPVPSAGGVGGMARRSAGDNSTPPNDSPSEIATQRATDQGAKPWDPVEVAKGEAAHMGIANAVTAQAEASMAANMVLQTRLKEMQEERAQQYAQWKQRGQQLQDKILNTEIDPNHFWATKGTGQKITAAISILLSGAHSGSAPNLALGVIDKAIDRDVDAQKTNLHKMETAYSFHLRNGEDDRNSYLLAKADTQEQAAAAIQGYALKYAGPIAQNQAALAVQGLRMNAEQARQQAASAGLTDRVKIEQIKNMQMEREFRDRQLKATERFYGGNQQASDMGYLDKDTRASMVQTGPGQYEPGISEKGAEEMRGAQQAHQEALNALNNLKAWRDARAKVNPQTGEKEYGWSVRSLNPAGREAKGAEDLQNQAKGAFLKYAGVPGLRGVDSKYIETLVQRPDLWQQGVVGDNYEQLEKMLNDSWNSYRNGHLTSRQRPALTPTRIKRPGE